MVTRVSAHQVGSYFVQQYYHMFQQQKDFVYQFYNDASSMIRIDGEISHSATDLASIHQVIMSLNFVTIEIKTIKSLDSWNGGVLVVVSGVVQSRDFIGWRRFVQTFFLAPQEKGYFVLNDIFHFTDEEVDQQNSIPVEERESFVDHKASASINFSSRLASDYTVEVDDYGDSAHNHVTKAAQDYSYEDHPQQDSEQERDPNLELEHVAKRLEDEMHLDQNSLHKNAAPTVYEFQHSVEEPVGEPEKLTYASILRDKGKSQASNIHQPGFSHDTVVATDWYTMSQPLPQQSNSSVPSPAVDASEEKLTASESTLATEEEPLSVYVRNLPSTITSSDIMREFENFGKIKHDGIFLRNRMDTGVCYAFVEFEDIQSVRNAIKASPIQLAGRRVYIEERRPGSLASRGGRNAGRGRIGRGGRTSGRRT